MKIAIIGYGKMGQIIERLGEEKKHEVVSTIDPVVGTAKFKELNKENLRGADVAIDFTAPGVILSNIDKYIDFGVNAVIGTTGWYENLEEVKEKVETSEIGFVWAANFSVGVNLFFRIIEHSAGLMSNFPLYLRILCPRKSNPSLICESLVFVADSSKPRSFRKVTIAGLTLCSSTSIEAPVTMKSSA